MDQSIHVAISTAPIEFLDEKITCPCGALVEVHINHELGKEKRYDGHMMHRDCSDDPIKPCPLANTVVEQQN